LIVAFVVFVVAAVYVTAVFVAAANATTTVVVVAATMTVVIVVVGYNHTMVNWGKIWQPQTIAHQNDRKTAIYKMRCRVLG
jgi:hypothetical protein